MRSIQRRSLASVFTFGAVLALGAAGAASATTEPIDTASADTTSADTATAGSDAGGVSDATGTIALLLPESQTARYEAHDRPEFEARVAERCPGCTVNYQNANQDSAQQQAQAEAAITEGAGVLVLDPVDAQAAGAIVTMAEEAGIPVISYDRLVLGVEGIDLYVSFDNERVGVLQATALVEKLAADGVTEGDIVMINGSPTDNNATLFKAGAHSVFDESGFTIAAESDTVEWEPSNAQADMEGHITTVGAENIVGVYAANDGTAGGAISAMVAAGIDPLPPVTGQDAELAAIQRIVTGEQFMTVYKATKTEAETAADAAITLLEGGEVTTELTVDNGATEVPSILLDPVAVTIDNLADTVIADGFWTVADICTDDFAEACAAAGLDASAAEGTAAAAATEPEATS